MITPKPHQEKFAELCWATLRVKGYVYLSGKPRSGKTLTSILTAEKSTKINNVLVLCPKQAIKGWLPFIEGRNHNYTVTNYEQVGRVVKGKIQLKLNPKDYDLVIIDESHNLSAIPKPTSRIKMIKMLCWNMPHIHLSGTSIVEGANTIYPQMTISKYNPFSQFRTFYDFFRHYGIPYQINIAGNLINQYDRFKPELLEEINKFTIYMTQEDAGISEDLQAIDKVHYVELSKETKELYNKLQKDQIVKIQGKELVCDSVMKLRTSLHMIESGVAKIGDEYILLGNKEKIDYIKEHFGDRDDIGIMCHFIGERRLLEDNFRFANIYSSTSHAEGVDLSHLSHYIILSSDYRGSKFIQRRERIININGSSTLTVHHILVKKAISEQVYKRVSKKQDFNNSTYKRDSL